MKTYQDEQAIGQLEKRKGGYFFLKILADVVARFPQQRHQRLLCTLDGQLTFRCGLNHLGDGHFFIIVSGKNLKSIGKTLGDTVRYELAEDPDPLGVPMPEVLAVLLAQDDGLQSQFDGLTMGKKRHVIHTIAKIKDIDLQVQKAVETIQAEAMKGKKR